MIDGLRLTAAAALVLLPLSACSADDGGNTDDDGYELLIQSDWTVPPGVDGGKTYCVRQTVTEDMYIGGFETVADLGTHHTLLSAGNPISDDGVFECGSFEHNFTAMIYESSTGVDPFELPPGVAAKVPAGAQLNLNFHVVNATDHDLSGITGTRILRRNPEEVTDLATMIQMAGDTLEIPPGEQTILGGECTLPHDVTVYGVNPHMHAFGTHMKVVVNDEALGETVIHDEDFTFDGTKRLYPFDPTVTIKQGDVVDVYCSYNNTTGDMIYWGTDSYRTEMCAAGVYLSPPEGLLTVCGS